MKRSFIYSLVLITLFLSALLTGCAVQVPVPKHTIMGSESYGFANYLLTLQTETERAAFDIKLFTLKYDECVSGSIDYVEFDGTINADSVKAFKSVLAEAQGCKNKKGRFYYPFIYLNSTSGEFKDGYALGDLFRQFNVETIVTQGQTCKGACAVAFIGGKLRKIEANGALIFSSTKPKGIGIDCELANEQVQLRAHFQKMFDTKTADRVYFNLLNFCAQPGGWFMGSEVAKSWGVVNE